MFTDFRNNTANQLAVSGLRKVVGNLPGMLQLSKGKTSRSPQATLSNFSSINFISVSTSLSIHTSLKILPSSVLSASVPV